MKKPRTPPPITAAYLERVTSWYLERWSSTSGNLHRKLMDRVRRSIAEHGGDRGAAEELVSAEIARLERLGWLDDRRFAMQRGRSLRERGESDRKVRAKLFQKGVAGEVIDAVLLELEGSNAQAAWTFARKRRLGPWRDGSVTREQRQKELAKMGRAGFSFDIARGVVDAESTTAHLESSNHE